eukprot:m51a1_g13539 hypothetical protein (108) ;mRNA; r:384-835
MEQRALDKAEAGVPLTPKEAETLDKMTWKAEELARGVGEKVDVEGLLDKVDAGEPLTRKQRAVLGGREHPLAPEGTASAGGAVYRVLHDEDATWKVDREQMERGGAL